MLERVREERDEDAEAPLAGKLFSDLTREQLPACIVESGAFMSPMAWHRRFEHPYHNIKKASETHGHLQPTLVEVAPFSTFAVPFNWMLRGEQGRIQDGLPDELPPDAEPPFPSPWVFGRERQEALLRHFFGQVSPRSSLVFFYTKEGQPLGEHIPRLVVGVGTLDAVADVAWYQTDGKPSYPMWDRLISHSIRPEGNDGFLIPYHDYLDATGDPVEDARRQDLLAEVAVPADPDQIRSFSYAAELATPDIALSALVRIMDSVRSVRAHGIAPGPWDRREEWLNAQIARTWEERGPFPGLGSALEALGVRLGTALSLDLVTQGVVGVAEDPWPAIDGLFKGSVDLPRQEYRADVQATAGTWASLSLERRQLAQLLSRFALSPTQAQRWFDKRERDKATDVAIEDSDILQNPYRIVEVDIGSRNELPVSLGTADRALMPDSTVALQSPIPEPSAVTSPQDPRRIRAAVSTVLRRAERDGDSLLAVGEVLDRLEELPLSAPINASSDWFIGHADWMEGVVDVSTIPLKRGLPPTAVLQRTPTRAREERLSKILRARALKSLDPPKDDWRALLIQAIGDAGSEVDPSNPRHDEALSEQTSALQRLTSRRLSTLVGRAGTGKTAVVGALVRSTLSDDGVLLLAPTGKARVKLKRATGHEAMTVAQFLFQLGRYDGSRQRVLFQGDRKWTRERTVVVDECSMLTQDELLALLEALDLGHVQRLILVGDPNQLPPIGIGRPFADLVGTMDEGLIEGMSEARARLTVEVRTSAGAPSDALRLASWFTNESKSPAADRVLSELEHDGRTEFTDLELCLWSSPDELRIRLLEQFEKHLGIEGATDIAGFDRALGLHDGMVDYRDPSGAEHFQVLSPVRMRMHGVNEINRWVQRTFRGSELAAARARSYKRPLGDQEIMPGDKVIQLRNGVRKSYDWNARESGESYLANGEVGLAGSGKSNFTNVVFGGLPGITFGYQPREFSGGASAPLELAYALTVHKAQGSEFQVVFVILPAHTRLLSRELIYTALTRSRTKLILLMEGEDFSSLYELSTPERSVTARRNTNMFGPSIRPESDSAPFAEHLIHRTDKGHLVRSKSELVIANKLYHLDIDYEYERPLEGTDRPGRLRPDFSFVDASGDIIVWEHLGMLDKPSYARDWEWKLEWYEENGFQSGLNLFVSQEREGLDSKAIEATAKSVMALL